MNSKSSSTGAGGARGESASRAERPFYERLSAQDSSFVMWEQAGTHVHVTAVAMFDPGPLQEQQGGLDMDRTRAYVESRLHLIPAYRRKLAWTPVQGHPIWIDDDRFDIAYHVRHAALPRPGSSGQLKELAAAIASQPLDLDRPLWELWFVEGLEGGRFAFVAKIHHSMVDGVSGVGVAQALLSPTPETEFEPGPRFRPRPAPGVLDFVADGINEGADFAAMAVRRVSEGLRSPIETASSLFDTAAAGAETLRAGLSPTPDTPLNQVGGRQRLVDWFHLDLAEVRDVRKRLDGTINDVVVATVAGGLRRYLREQRVKLQGLDLRVIVPVDTRRGPEDESVANRVSAWFLSVPVGQRDPRRRFNKIRSQTRHLKKTNAARGIDGFLRFADLAGSSRLPYLGVNLVNALRPYNLIITNVHGPQIPLYLQGAPLREFTPQVPLFDSQAIAVAAMSYLGRIHVGLLADRDLLPDVDRLAAAMEASFAELKEAAYSL